MLAPARMKRVHILVLERDIKKVTESLGHMGIVQLTEEEPASGALMKRASKAEELQRVRKAIGRAERLLRRLHIQPGPARPMRGYGRLEKIEEKIREIEEEVGEVLHTEEEISEEIAKIEQLIRDISAFEGIPVRIEQLEDSLFLHFAMGFLPAEKIQPLKNESGSDVVIIPYTDAEGNEKVVSVTSKKGRWALESNLSKYGFRAEPIAAKYQGLPDEILKRARERLQELKNRERILFVKTASLREKYAGLLLFLRKRLAIEEKVILAEENFPRSWATYFISGWVPEEKVESLTSEIQRITGEKAIIEVSDPEESEVRKGVPPVLFRNWRLLKPFQLLVSTYGVPAYGEVEPTLVVAVSFITMFGIMFGDVGQGAVLLVAGLLLKRFAGSSKMKDVGVILSFAGVSSAVFGLLYGSVFSKQGLLPALWTHPLSDIYSFLRISIIVGIVMISLGIILNIVNRFRLHDYVRGILDKFGLVGGVFYWGALGLALKYLVFKRAPLSWEIILLIVVPLLILFFREPLMLLLIKKKEKIEGGWLTAMMEGMVEVLETFMVYIANTASFLRVGAFALAHAGLSLAVFSIASTVREAPAGIVWATLAVFLGNAIIILLEGLVVAIQSIRLEYYEFFTKFFHGGGREFRPFEI